MKNEMNKDVVKFMLYVCLYVLYQFMWREKCVCVCGGGGGKQIEKKICLSSGYLSMPEVNSTYWVLGKLSEQRLH